MAVALLWVGCENEGMNEPKQEVSFPLSIYLPAEETNLLTNGGGPRRVMGDPGTTEQFALPNYVYIIVMKKTGESTWELWRVITESGLADEEKWTKKRYTGPLMSMSDSIYQYNKEFNELLDPGESNFDGRVYAVASSVELSFNKTLDESGITNLSDLENLTFNSAPVQANLQHIYSTPFNYIVDDDYYGSFGSTQKVPHVDLMLYHVAAKVDINWNVADSVRISKKDPSKAVRLTYMRAQNLFNRNAYCFKPMANTSGTDSLASGSTVDIISATDEGLWWEGRSYFYTIPYTCTKHPDRFPLQMKMATNDSTKYYQPTIYMNVEYDTIFVPWLRATFNLSKPLTEGADVKTAG